MTTGASFESSCSVDVTRISEKKISVNSKKVVCEVGQHAKRSVVKLLQNSLLFENSPPQLKQLSLQDVVIGEKLGSGGFSEVHECTLEGNKYAIKHLKPSVRSDMGKFKTGAGDLALEAYFLQALDHPNIVKLHGVRAGNIEDTVGDFFIVIDQLEETLENRIYQWREDQDPKVLRRTWSDKTRKSEQSSLLERIKLASQIADVLHYLQTEKNILYRDLKPENLGFDSEGQLKLFGKLHDIRLIIKNHKINQLKPSSISLFSFRLRPCKRAQE